jgi:nitrile hydratase
MPMRPAGTDGLNEAELAALISRDCLVGAALPGKS